MMAGVAGTGDALTNATPMTYNVNGGGDDDANDDDDDDDDDELEDLDEKIRMAESELRALEAAGEEQGKDERQQERQERQGQRGEGKEQHDVGGVVATGGAASSSGSVVEQVGAGGPGSKQGGPGSNPTEPAGAAAAATVGTVVSVPRGIIALGMRVVATGPDSAPLDHRMSGGGEGTVVGWVDGEAAPVGEVPKEWLGGNAHHFTDTAHVVWDPANGGSQLQRGGGAFHRAGFRSRFALRVAAPAMAGAEAAENSRG